MVQNIEVLWIFLLMGDLLLVTYIIEDVIICIMWLFYCCRIYLSYVAVNCRNG